MSWCLPLKKGQPRQCFGSMSAGQSDPLGTFLDKTSFWRLIGEEGYFCAQSILCVTIILPGFRKH
jgi:hypothetical protein